MAGIRRIAETKYATGTASKQDALRAEVESYQLEHEAIQLERMRRETLATLNTLLNRAPYEALPPPADLPEPQTLPPSQDYLTAALAARPELRALEARIKADHARVELAQRNFYPDFNASAGYNSLWGEQELRTTIGVSVNIPLHWGRLRAAEAEAKARLSSNEWNLVGERNQLLAEVQKNYDRLVESRHVLDLYRKRLLPAARDNLEAARSDYSSRAGDFLSLTSAERNLHQTELRSAQAAADVYAREAELERSVGHAVPSDTTQPVGATSHE